MTQIPWHSATKKAFAFSCSPQCHSKCLRLFSFTGFALSKYNLSKLSASCHFVFALSAFSCSPQCHSKCLRLFSFTGFALSKYNLPKLSASCHFVILHFGTAHCLRAICSFWRCRIGSSYLSMKSSPRNTTSLANLMPLGTVNTDTTLSKERSGI